MKLRNKKTGEIGLLSATDNAPTIFVDSRECKTYNSLAELCEEWTDYEEPKEYWYVGYKNIVRKADEPFSENGDNSITEKRKEIGNYFSSEKEAELAVEKLKAWKRLKDKGLEFDSTPNYGLLCGNGFEIDFSAIMPPEFWNDNDTKKELTFLFGGEE